eukprot:2875881-Rhodomonas_salina.1
MSHTDGHAGQTGGSDNRDASAQDTDLRDVLVSESYVRKDEGIITDNDISAMRWTLTIACTAVMRTKAADAMNFEESMV